MSSGKEPNAVGLFAKESLLVLGTLISDVPFLGALVRLVDKYETEGRLAEIEARFDELARCVGRRPEEVAGQLHQLASLVSDEPLQRALRKTESCLAVCSVLNRRTELGQQLDPFLSYDEVLALVRSLIDPADLQLELKLVTYELDRHNLIGKVSDANSPLGWRGIGPTQSFFWRTDPLFQAWRPAADAKEVCRRSLGDGILRSEDMNSVLQWPVRRFNSVLAYLDFHGLIEFWEDFGARDYSVSSAQLTEEGHFFANEDDPAA